MLLRIREHNNIVFSYIFFSNIAHIMLLRYNKIQYKIIILHIRKDTL